MTKQRNETYLNVSTFKKVFIPIVVLGILFGGMFAFIMAIPKIRNYQHPYLFCFVFGAIGFIFGIYTAKLLKPIVILNATMLSNYSLFTHEFSIGFIGWFIMLGHYFNLYVSTQAKCDQFVVIDHNHIRGVNRAPELNMLCVNIDGHLEKLLCNYEYWKNITVGQTVNICIYKSQIGFDHLTLTDDY